MSSENQQNPSQENEKIKEKLINIINICLLAVVAVVLAFIIVFSIVYFVAPPKDISQYKELLIVIIPLAFLFLFTTCLAKRLKTTFFENIKKKMSISSNFIFNMLIISCLATACSLNTLVTTSSEIINETDTQKRHQELKDEIRKIKTQCNIDNTIKETEYNIKNKEKESQTQDSNIITQPIEETQTQNNDVITPKTQQSKDINEKTNTLQKECECNNSKNIQEKDESINTCNEKNNKNEDSSHEILEIFAKFLIIFGTAFFAFLSAYFFVQKDKIEDYLDTIDEQNS
ncbi:hypothetical protein [Mannheimia indoligenes]|uniref:Transmembrane protein n=1 Tax=Mannheimia indoligenes TaxID=3103145 RepID=A0ABU7ZBV7_9PAST